MGSKIRIALAIFIVLFVILIILVLVKGAQGLAGSRIATKNSKTPVVVVKKTVNAGDIASDPVVYEGYAVEVNAQIIDWVTNKSFTLNAGGGGFAAEPKQLLVIAKGPFPLTSSTSGNQLGLGETVNVDLKGRVAILDRKQLQEELGINLDGDQIALDDNNINQWKLGPVIILDSVTKQ